ncbi:MAG: nuclear transport factor 2 family protein [Burkholderiaceae bacterium]
MSDTVTHDFLDAFAQAWNRHDASGIASMMTPDAVMQLSFGPTKAGITYTGHDEIIAGANFVFAQMPDVQWLEPHHVIAGDRGISQWVLVATGPDGQRIETNGCDVFTFRGGLIAVKDTYRKNVV